MISAAEPGNTGEPRFTANQLPDRYADALLDHLAHPGEPGLLTAQVLGRLALGDGVGLLEWAAVHHEALEALLLRMLMDETPAGGDGDSRLGGGDSRLGGGDSRLGRIRHLRGLLRSLTPQERTAAMQAAQSFFTRSLAPYEASRWRLEEAMAAFSQRNSQLEQRAGRVAHALYDETLQLLAAVNLVLHQAARQLPRENREYISQAGRFLDQMESQLADLSFELRPYILDNGGLDAAIRTAATYYSNKAQLAIAVELSPPGPLSWTLTTILYRAVQEVLTNICAHARATSANILLACEGEVIRCCVRDNGIGFDPSQVFLARGKLGLGLIGIRESISPFGGTLMVQSGPDRGTELQISALRRHPGSHNSGGVVPRKSGAHQPG